MIYGIGELAPKLLGGRPDLAAQDIGRWITHWIRHWIRHRITHWTTHWIRHWIGHWHRQHIRRHIGTSDIGTLDISTSDKITQWKFVQQDRWDSISMDFLTNLPEVDGRNAVLVVVDRLSKMAHFIPLRFGPSEDPAPAAPLPPATTQEITRLLLEHVLKLAHGGSDEGIPQANV